MTDAGLVARNRLTLRCLVRAKGEVHFTAERARLCFLHVKLPGFYFTTINAELNKNMENL